MDTPSDAPAQRPRFSLVGPLWLLAAFTGVLFTIAAAFRGPAQIGPPPTDVLYWQPYGGHWTWGAIITCVAGYLAMSRKMTSRRSLAQVMAGATSLLALFCWFTLRAANVFTPTEVVVRAGAVWNSDRHLPLANLQRVDVACGWRPKTKSSRAHYEPGLVLVFPDNETFDVGGGVNDVDFQKWLNSAAAIAALPAVQAAPHGDPTSLDANCIRHFADMLDPDRQHAFYAVMGVAPA